MTHVGLFLPFLCSFIWPNVLSRPHHFENPLEYQEYSAITTGSLLKLPIRVWPEDLYVNFVFSLIHLCHRASNCTILHQSAVQLKQYGIRVPFRPLLVKYSMPTVLASHRIALLQWHFGVAVTAEILCYWSYSICTCSTAVWNGILLDGRIIRFAGHGCRFAIALLWMCAVFKMRKYEAWIIQLTHMTTCCCVLPR